MDKPLIIFDTDMDTDCDDAGALALLLNAHKRGECTLLGIIGDTPIAAVAPYCEVLCNAYGVCVPIGAVYEQPLLDTPQFADYKTHYGELDGKHYNAILSAHLHKTDTDYPTAVSLYRRLLTEADDNSVTVLCVGLLTAFAQLLSTANGVELVRQKVKRVITMGNAAYPEQRQYNFNYKMDRAGAAVFFEKCPAPIYVCPFGSDIVTGHTLSAHLPDNHPLRRAYEIYNGEHRGRASWDLVCAWFGVYPDSPFFTAQTHGSVRYDPAEHRTYWVDEARTDYHLSSAISSNEWMTVLEKELYG